MSKVLYRKYRPIQLADVVGQSQTTSALENALKTHKIGHAYLFIGPRGCGKTSVARIFAHAVNKFDYKLEDHYLDIIEIDAASNTGVDNIRELREKSIIAPVSGKYKVYIIDEVHMLSKSASNALLKTLEEPPEHVIFIMATTEPERIPITITSRAEIFTFRLATPETMLSYLKTIAKKEQIDITDEALEIIAHRGGGSFRDTLSLLDQITILMEGQITADALNHALGLPTKAILTQILSAYCSKDASTIHQLILDLLSQGLSPTNIASELINLIIRNPEPPLIPLLAALPTVSDPFSEAKLLVALLENLSSNTQKSDVSKTSNLTKHPQEQIITAPQPAVKKSAPTIKPTPSQDSISSIPPKDFDWTNFTDHIKATSEATFLQLRSCDFEFRDQTLHLYPRNKFAVKILKEPKNVKILTDHLSGSALKIHEPQKNSPSQDATISRISAIMGGADEVDDANMPF